MIWSYRHFIISYYLLNKEGHTKKSKMSIKVKKVGLNPTKTMIIYSILSLLLSNAATLRRDMSILYSRVAIIILLHCISIAFCSLFIYKSLCKGIGLFGGLFHATSLTQIFHIFIFLLSAIILQLTAFYPRKV